VSVSDAYRAKQVFNLNLFLYAEFEDTRHWFMILFLNFSSMQIMKSHSHIFLVAFVLLAANPCFAQIKLISDEEAALPNAVNEGQRRSGFSGK
jgi:hypothetical protein